MFEPTFKVQFLMSTDIDESILGISDGKTKFEKFLYLLCGEDKTIPNLRDNLWAYSLFNLGIMTRKLVFQHNGPVRVIDLPNQIKLWIGSILDWRNELILHLTKDQSNSEIRIFYSGVLVYLEQKISSHLFYGYETVKLSEYTYYLRSK